MMTNTSDIATPVFQLKGSLFTLTTLHVFAPDLELLDQQLANMVKQAPKFFQKAPVIIDLQKLRVNEPVLNLVELVARLRRHGLIPVGIRHAAIDQQKAAVDVGLALFPDAKTESATPPLTTARPAATTQAPAAAKASRVITEPVRSGQQIYAKECDLIVLATVSHGAELLADGHIHVYGALRGRALAGVSGNTDARIFCKSLEAELVAIAGHYWVNEDIKAPTVGHAVQIYLKDEKLSVAEI